VTDVASAIAAIGAGQMAFVEAIQGAAGRWNAEILVPEVPERTVPAMRRPWTPGYACWHVVSTHWAMADMAVDHARRARIGEAPPVRGQYNASWWASHQASLDELREALADPARARARAEERFRLVAAALGDLSGEDMNAPWDPGDFNRQYLRSLGSSEVPPSVGTLVNLMAVHLHDHASQICETVG
jgi:DinB superfamily